MTDPSDDAPDDGANTPSHSDGGDDFGLPTYKPITPSQLTPSAKPIAPRQDPIDPSTRRASAEQLPSQTPETPGSGGEAAPEPEIDVASESAPEPEPAAAPTPPSTKQHVPHRRPRRQPAGGAGSAPKKPTWKPTAPAKPGDGAKKASKTSTGWIVVAVAVMAFVMYQVITSGSDDDQDDRSIGVDRTFGEETTDTETTTDTPTRDDDDEDDDEELTTLTADDLYPDAEFAYEVAGDDVESEATLLLEDAVDHDRCASAMRFSSHEEFVGSCEHRVEAIFQSDDQPYRVSQQVLQFTDSREASAFESEFRHELASDVMRFEDPGDANAGYSSSHLESSGRFAVVTLLTTDGTVEEFDEPAVDAAEAPVEARHDDMVSHLRLR